MKKKVLVIGLVDSVHLARWLSQFRYSNIDFYIFPSKKFRRLHYDLRKLLKAQFTSKFIYLGFAKYLVGFGFLEYMFFEIFSKISSKNTHKKYLSRVLSLIKFDYIHAIEIQGAGYLYCDTAKGLNKDTKLILTNWGSDIYFYQKEPLHLLKIKNILKLASFYSAECTRDYQLAKKYGFAGIELPCIPNAGGFDPTKIRSDICRPSQRNLISTKGYGGKFGLAHLVIPTLIELNEKVPQFDYLFYSVTEDIYELIRSAPKKFREKARVFKVEKPIPHELLLEYFTKSRLLISASQSDGISTSFLESIVTGAYPIQTDTSCANEWLEKGFLASIVSINQEDIRTSIIQAALDNSLVDYAFEINQKLSKNLLDLDKIANTAKIFYSN